ncbi:MAG: YifB family Mg chelatase-like AAA ATPase [Burkholderiaceae bacterium]|nr:YifB family Mg chelatase-like AAA ATPase [Burkholderiaceae bacterium]
MNLAIVKSRALTGMQASAVAVEVHLANGLPSITLVGLPETEVKEARERVRAALINSGFEFPMRRITINLAPADLPKESGSFDLPIALGVLAASGQIPAESLASYEFAGELSLTGQLRRIRGALAMAYAVSKTENQSAAFVLPSASADEAALVSGVAVYAADNLLEVCSMLCGSTPLPLAHPTISSRSKQTLNIADVKGQGTAKRALEVAATGGHATLLVGPPGTGKSMLAQHFCSLLPPMTEEEALESAAVLNLSNRFDIQAWKTRPFRSPHHTASAVALVGGGSYPRPGEISLAHKGVLFLDELPEFDRKVLEVLREPLESGKVTVSRAARQIDFPAQFQLIAAMNPCPCGYLGHKVRNCRCTPDQIARYQGRISGPLLDRIDIQIEVAALSEEELLSLPQGESSSAIAERVTQARKRALQRQNKPNALLDPGEIMTYCQMQAAAETLLKNAMAKFAWSARATHRVLKLSRSVADLANSEKITASHIAECIQYRRVLIQN